MNSVHGRFAHLTSSRTQADASAAAHEHTNACTLLRLPDAHLPPDFLILRRRPDRGSLLSAAYRHATSRGRSSAHGSERGYQSLLLGHSRFQSPRLEQGGRSGRWLSGERGVPAVDRRARTPYFPGPANLYSEPKQHVATSNSLKSLIEHDNRSGLGQVTGSTEKPVSLFAARPNRRRRARDDQLAGNRTPPDDLDHHAGRFPKLNPISALVAQANPQGRRFLP